MDKIKNRSPDFSDAGRAKRVDYLLEYADIMLKKVAKLYTDAYAGLPRGAWMLALADFINRTGFMVLVFLNIYLTKRLHFSLAQAGRILGAYGIGTKGEDEGSEGGREGGRAKISSGGREGGRAKISSRK